MDRNIYIHIQKIRYQVWQIKYSWNIQDAPRQWPEKLITKTHIWLLFFNCPIEETLPQSSDCNIIENGGITSTIDIEKQFLTELSLGDRRHQAATVFVAADASREYRGHLDLHGFGFSGYVSRQRGQNPWGPRATHGWWGPPRQLWSGSLAAADSRGITSYRLGRGRRYYALEE